MTLDANTKVAEFPIFGRSSKGSNRTAVEILHELTVVTASSSSTATVSALGRERMYLKVMK